MIRNFLALIAALLIGAAPVAAQTISGPTQPTFPLLAPDGTAAAPSYSFGSDPNTGIMRPAPDWLSFVTGGVIRGYFTTTAFRLPSSIPIGMGDTLDAQIARAAAGSFTFSNASTNSFTVTAEAANTMALRNGTAAQIFSVYNTYTDGSNYERGGFAWSSNVLRVGTELAGGTGSSRPMSFVINGSRIITLNTNGSLTWDIDNTFDIGASGANRPRTVYAATSVVAPAATFSGTVNAGNVFASASSALGFATRTTLTAPSDGALTVANNAATNSVTLTVGASNLLTLNGGLTAGGGVTVGPASVLRWDGASAIYGGLSNGSIQLRNAANTGFNLLQFGGTTSPFPALKRSGAALQVRLADDSGDAALTASTVQTVTGYSAAGTALPTCNAGAAGTRAYVTDATAPTFLGAYVSGGAVVSPVFCTGAGGWVTGANDNFVPMEMAG